MIRRTFDIGLVYRSNHNYGANLTHYALANVLLRQGKRVLLIDMPSGLGLSLPMDRDDPFELFSQNPYRVINSMESIHQNILEDNVIYVWRAKHIWEIDETNKVCKMFLVGSDQLWRYYFLKGSAYYSLLGWSAPDRYCASYATSFGVDTFECGDEEKKFVGTLLKRLKRKSTREKSGTQIVKELSGTEAEWVIDPVFLLDKEDYLQITNNDRNDHSIGFYILDFSDNKCNFLLKQIKKANGSCVGYADAMVEKNVKSCLSVYISDTRTVESWLNMVENSEFVITDSFHGMCFAIILHKPFIVIADDNIQRGYSRIFELLNRIGLERHIISEELLDCIRIEEYRNINYVDVDRYLKCFIQESKDWLIETINEGLAGKYNNTVVDDYWRCYSQRVYYEYNKKQNALSEIINSRFAKDRKCVIWGTGGKFYELSQLIMEMIDPVYVVDNNSDKWGKIFWNCLECRNPEILKDKDYFVIILIENRRAVNSIVNQLSHYGIREYITYEEIMERV